jgi:excinuclease ABC subunit A
MPFRSISIRGARTHNLKNISVDIPQRVLTVITGPSGSGKSSLAFDTLYAEGQRRFVESMSTYVRQFLERMERPDVDEIEGILPAIAIEQENSVKNARSTVATATELADYFRLFMTYCGETFCPRCEVRVRRETPESVTRQALEAFDGRKVVVLAPLFFVSDEARTTAVQQLVKGGYYRAWIDGAIADIKELDLSAVSSLEIVTGRVRVAADQHDALADAVEQAFSLSSGLVNLMEQSGEFWLSHRFSGRFSCDRCGDEFPDPSPHLFSFNSPLGACVDCQGYGRVMGIDMDKVIPVRSQRLDELPIAPWNSPGYEDCYEDLEKAAKKYRLRLDVPIEQLTAEEWDILYAGRGKWYGIKGFFDWLETKKYKIHVRVKLAKYRNYTACHSCSGSRLKAAARNVWFRDLDIAALFAMNVRTARQFWQFLPLSKEEEAIAGHLRREILNRLTYLDEVGLSYLTLDRQTRTLSGGEAQRINLSAALGSSLTETLYVIDEPTVGLHARDSERLLMVLRRLRNSGNTVVVVEHDPTIITGADHVVALGPGAGELGGAVLATGKPAEVLAIQGEEQSRRPARRTIDPDETITIVNAREHNLKGLTVSIPLQSIVAVTGVSGSGKSTLIRDCLYNIYQRAHRGTTSGEIGAVDRIEGAEGIDDMQFIDQSPIGRSSRSNPATYTKAWDEIRKLLSESATAKVNGVTAGMLSFNTKGGRCDTCEGAGTVVIDMQFLADVEIVCENCQGRRFKDAVLKVTHKGKSAHDVLQMTVDEAIRFFVDKRAIVRKLDSLRAVGLGYLRLGQSTATLSGGEAQRLKLASFLGNEKGGGRRLFLFDEPTTGLHATDVRQLIRTFRQLVDGGNSVLVIEHNIQLIEACDWVIDLGPEGGDGGGELLGAGTPEEIASTPGSVTGTFLFRDPALVPPVPGPSSSVLK